MQKQIRISLFFYGGEKRIRVIAKRASLLAKAIVYAQRFVASNNATHSCGKSHNRWLCPLRSISANASACFSLRLWSALRRKGSRRRRHDATQRAEFLLLSTEKQKGQAKMLVRFVGGKPESQFELFVFRKSFIVAVHL